MEEALEIEKMVNNFIPIAQIASFFQKKEKEVEEALASAQRMRGYFQFTKDPKAADRYSFFSKDCPPEVARWVYDNEKNTRNYYKLITPVNGIAKIRSATMGRSGDDGNLRTHFKELVKNANKARGKEILDDFIKNPETDLMEAYESLLEADPLLKHSWILKLKNTKNKFLTLQGQPKEIESLKKDEKLKRPIVDLYMSLKRIVKMMGIDT